MEPHFHACIVDGDEPYGIATLSRVPIAWIRRVALPVHDRSRSEPRFALSTTLLERLTGAWQILRDGLGTSAGESS